MQQWYRGTSICGISNARDAKSTWEAAAWTAVATFAVVFTCVQVCRVLDNYFRFEVDTKVEVLHRNLVGKARVQIGLLLPMHRLILFVVW